MTFSHSVIIKFMYIIIFIFAEIFLPLASTSQRQGCGRDVGKVFFIIIFLREKSLCD
jgi:hypothetical protein